MPRLSDMARRLRRDSRGAASQGGEGVSRPEDAPAEKPAPSQAGYRHGGITRRQFAAGSAAVGAATLAATALSGCGGDGGADTSGTPQVVEDDSQAIYITDEYGSDATPPEAASTWQLPLGTVPFHSEGVYAALMQVADTAATPNTVGVLSLATGTATTLIASPTQGSQYELFDVRCSESVFAWVEVNYADRSWKLMAQGFSAGALADTPVQLETGTSDYDPPRFAVTGSSVIWQYVPSTNGTKTSENSYCRIWTLGDDKGVQVWESPGRFGCSPRVSGGILTIVPRVREDEGQYYGMTALDLSDGSRPQVDQLVLPQTVRPLEATYMGDKFAFSIEATYSSRGLLGEMGTYIGREGGPYLVLASEPLACVAGNGSKYLIKSQGSHVYVDAEAQQRGRIAAPDRALSYGDYPASEGTTDRFVTYATVRDEETGMPSNVTVRLFNL